MKIFICVMVLLFSFSVRSDDDAPTWVKNPQKSCKKHQFCTVGSAAGVKLAEADARAGIAKIFETKISSKFTQSISSQNDQVNQNMSEEIKEEVNDTIKGIEIKDSYEGKLDVYVLAVLDKKKAAKGYKKEIEQIDEKMKVLVDDTSARSVRKAMKMYLKRETLNARYQFLSGRSIKSAVSYEKIFKKSKAAVKGVKIFVSIREDEPKEIEALVVASLTEMGYKVFRGQKYKDRGTHQVTGEFIPEKQFMKVEGWEKYKFILNLYGANAKGAKSGSLQFNTVMQGRSLKDSLAKAMPKVKEYLKENISDLNIE